MMEKCTRCSFLILLEVVWTSTPRTSRFVLRRQDIWVKRKKSSAPFFLSWETRFWASRVGEGKSPKLNIHWTSKYGGVSPTDLRFKFCSGMLLHRNEDSTLLSLNEPVNGGCSLPQPAFLEIAFMLSLFAFCRFNVVEGIFPLTVSDGLIWRHV